MTLIAALLIAVKHWKLYKYSSEEDWLTQLWSISTPKYCVAIKKNMAIFYIYSQSEETMVYKSVVKYAMAF